MNPVSNLVWKFSANARRERGKIFRQYFPIDQTTKILDLGSENGTNIHNVLEGTDFLPANVYIADIDERAVSVGNERFGFTPVVVDETGSLPFANKFFDIVFCSSVVEHVTVEKRSVWEITNGREFKELSWARQNEFAAEIDRLGKGYFVQTPSRSFPIESHTWLPLVGYLPREMLVPILRVTNRYWIKGADPDFNLLSKNDMRELFPGADIIAEKKVGLTKSLMAIKAK